MIAQHSPLCCLNGEYTPQDAIKIDTQNRAFRYGDSLFETFRCFGNQPFMLDLHYERLLKAMVIMGMETTYFPTLEILEKKVESLINKNRFFGSSRLRLTVFRNNGGNYAPTTNSCSYLIEATPIDEPSYNFNTKGLIAGIYTDLAKQPSILSPFKTGNSLIYVLAGQYKTANNLSEVLIVNTKGLIVEALSSNLFWFKNNELYTPHVSSGCIDGIMRQMVIKVASLFNIKVNLVEGLDSKDLTSIDELFVTNSVQGIRWIVGIGENRYYNIKTRQLFQSFINTIN